TRKYHSSFYPSEAHQQLHSFPTRRSSDLDPSNLCRRRHAMRPGNFAFWLGTVAVAGLFGAAATAQPAPKREPAPCFGQNCPRQPDRKSTRLNSSHLVISYAVFCLKKKT